VSRFFVRGTASQKGRRKMPTLLSTGEAARMLGMNRRFVYRQVKSGNLQKFKLPDGMHTRIELNELRRFAKDTDLTLREGRTLNAT
jgi:excisionase family DNA binding protein